VTFIIDVRGGGLSSGYISAGFFGGKELSFVSAARFGAYIFRS
jgi:hypothetical protein